MSAKAEEGSCVIDAQACYEEIAIQIRTHLGLPELIILCTRHKELFDELDSQWSKVVVDASAALDEKEEGETLPPVSKNSSLTNEQKFAHKQPTNPINKFNKLKRLSPGTGFQESKQEKPVPNNRVLSSGKDQIQLSEVVHAASERFKERLLVAKPTWPDVVETASHLASTLGITQTVWGNACQRMGRHGAAVCVMRVDLACQRTNNPVRNPQAYFCSLMTAGSA
ncbi:replication initiation protein RepC [Novipirellula caenicola]